MRLRLRFVIANLGVCLLLYACPALALPSDELIEHLEAARPPVGLLAYSPPSVSGRSGWRAGYRDGMNRLSGAAPRFPAAIASFEQCAQTATRARDSDGVGTCLFAKGSSELFAGRATSAVLSLRRAIGAIRKTRRNGLHPWDAEAVGDSGLLGLHVYHNLAAAYLAGGSDTGTGVGDPWSRGELRRSIANRDRVKSPHLAHLDSHRSSTAQLEPKHLVFANSNLERLHQDPSNLQLSILMPYTSLLVLVQLKDPAPPLARWVRRLSDDLPDDLPIRAVNAAMASARGGDAQQLLARATLDLTLRAGDVGAAELLVKRGAADENEMRGLLAAIRADALLGGFEQSAPDEDAGRAELIANAQEILANDQLAFLHPRAKRAIAQARSGISGLAQGLLNPRLVSVLTLGAIAIALAMLLWWLRGWVKRNWADWNNNLYFWNGLTRAGYQVDCPARDADDARRSGDWAQR
jgi:hypothetical protein